MCYTISEITRIFFLLKEAYMISTLCDIIGEGIVPFFSSLVNAISPDIMFFIALAVEALFVIFFIIKSLFSYEASLNRALEKMNVWLFDRKVVTENNIQELNMLFKRKCPKRLCYHWQQYILFREGTPSSYMSNENLVEKPLKTSSYNSNIKNLSIFTTLWAIITGMFMLLAYNTNGPLTGKNTIIALLVPIFVLIIGIVFVVYLRARKNAILNSLYQNCALFGRFMDNACVDLPSYIDYQILFTPQEIENGQPVLREFLDYKARKEKEEFNKAREENFQVETYDFSSAGVNGSMVLDRAMRESELFLKKKEKLLVKISQLEGELDTRRKNFDNVQKDYQGKIQASKENVGRLRQMQEETTNRIESNYYRKQQTTEIGKQEQLEQEFEQQRARYLLEKSEGEEEIAKLNAELESEKANVESAMLSEYQTFYNKFCQSAEKVVAATFSQKFDDLENENQKDKEYITQLEIKLKNKPDGTAETEQGTYDENGNYVYADGTFYDKDGNYHDVKGNVYSQEGTLISEAPKEPVEKQIVNFDDFDDFDFMTDVAQKADIYGVAEDVVNDVDKGVEVVNNNQRKSVLEHEELRQEQVEEEPKETLTPMIVEEENAQETSESSESLEPNVTKKKKGRPRKIVTTEPKISRPRGRPRKQVTAPVEKRKVGRPRKIVKDEPTEKRGRGRPRKNSASIAEINKKLSEEEMRINELRSSINQDLERAMNNINASEVDDKSARRDSLIKEIEVLQNEAQEAMKENNSEAKIAEINSKLEALLEEIKKLNL